MDTLEGKKSYLLSGANGEQVKLSLSAYSLLRSIHSGTTFAQLAETLNERKDREQVSEERLREKYESLVAELRRLEMQSARQTLPWGFWLRLRLVPENITAKIASRLSCLYHPLAVAVVLAVLTAAVLVAVHRRFALQISDTSFLPGVGLFLASLLVHEFGHASACARYGARPSEIGFTAYLIYPAFYSDVSSAWQLSRLQRVVVDVGGCYFQGIVTAGFLFAFYRTGWEPLRVAIIFSLYSALFSLNPVFKFDGYWVLADFLGVSNLSSQPRRIRKYLLDLVRRRPAEQLPWPAAVTSILVIYSCVTVVVWSYFVLRMFPMLMAQMTAVSHAIASVTAQIVARKLPSWRSLNTLFSSGAFLFLVLLMLWNVAKVRLQPAWHAIRRRVRVSSGEPLKEIADGPVPKLSE